MVGAPFSSVLVIGNPLSGGGQVGRWMDRVTDGFRTGGLAVEALLTGRAGDAREAASRAQGNGPLIVAFGGDGTFNEVLNGADLNRATLAVVPAGTGNVLAKELGMRRRPLDAVRQLLGGRVERLDVGECNGRRFASMFGAGVDAWAVRGVHECRGRRRLTQWHYVPHVARALAASASYGIRVEVDGEPFVADAVQVCVGNARSYGGPVEMTSAASPRDGLFDVMCVPRQDVGSLAVSLAWSLLHTMQRSRGIRYGRGRRVVVTSQEPDAPYQLDGESAGILPAEAVMRAGVARLLVPRGFRPGRGAGC